MNLSVATNQLVTIAWNSDSKQSEILDLLKEKMNEQEIAIFNEIIFTKDIHKEDLLYQIIEKKLIENESLKEKIAEILIGNNPFNIILDRFINFLLLAVFIINILIWFSGFIHEYSSLGWLICTLTYILYVSKKVLFLRFIINLLLILFLGYMALDTHIELVKIIGYTGFAIFLLILIRDIRYLFIKYG